MKSFRLRELRLDRGYTQGQIASALGITQQAYAHYENERRLPNIQLLCALADFYIVTLDYLLGRDDTPQPFMPLQPVELPAVPADVLSAAEREALSAFRALNAEGQTAALTMLRALAESTAYKKPPVSGSLQEGIG